jgi:hypothetical protein
MNPHDDNEQVTVTPEQVDVDTQARVLNYRVGKTLDSLCGWANFLEGATGWADVSVDMRVYIHRVQGEVIDKLPDTWAYGETPAGYMGGKYPVRWKDISKRGVAGQVVHVHVFYTTEYQEETSCGTVPPYMQSDEERVC